MASSRASSSSVHLDVSLVLAVPERSATPDATVVWGAVGDTFLQYFSWPDATMPELTVEWMDAEARRRLNTDSSSSSGSSGTAFVSFSVSVDPAKAAEHTSAAELAAAVADAANAAVSDGTLALALQARCGCAVDVASASVALADDVPLLTTGAPSQQPSQVLHHKIRIRKHKKGDGDEDSEEVEANEATSAAALAETMAAAADPHGKRDSAARLAAVEADLARRLLKRTSSRAAMAELDLEKYERQLDVEEEAAIEADAVEAAARAKAERRASRVVSVLDLQQAPDVLTSSRTLANLEEEAEAAAEALEGDRSSFSTSAVAALAVVGGLMALFGASGSSADSHIRRRGYEDTTAVDVKADTPL